MPLSVNVSTGLVKGRFGSGVVAGPNGEKLLVPARGRIDFEPVAPYVPYPTGTPSAFTILRKAITGILDSEGCLCTPHPDYPDVPGVRGLELYSPDDPQAGVQGWTWRGTPRFVNADGTRLHNTMDPFTFDLPYGEEVDLVNVVDMPQSPGIGKEQAIILAASAQAAATSAAGSAEAAAEAARKVEGALPSKADLIDGKVPADQLPPAVGVTDEVVAPLVDMPETAAKIDARVAGQVAGKLDADTAAETFQTKTDAEQAAETLTAAVAEAKATVGGVKVSAGQVSAAASRGLYASAQSVAKASGIFYDGIDVIETWQDYSEWSAPTAQQLSGGRTYSSGQPGGAAGMYRSFEVGAGMPFRAVFPVQINAGAPSGGLIVGVSDSASTDPYQSGASATVRGFYFSGAGLNRYEKGVSTLLDATAKDASAHWVVTVISDGTFLSFSARRADGTKEYRYRIDASTAATRSLAVWVGDNRQLGGNSVGPIWAKTTLASVRPRVSIENVATPAWSAIGSTNMWYATPAGFDSRVPTPMVLMFHGNTSDEKHWQDHASGRAIANAFLTEGYIVVGATSPNKSSFGNQASLDAYYDAYRYISQRFPIGPVVVYANSMGAMEGLLTIASGRVPGVVAYIATSASIDLAQRFTDPGNNALIRTAYGIAADGSDYAAKTSGHDAMRIPADDYLGLPTLLIAASDDAVVPMASHTEAFAAKVAGTSREVRVITTTGGHSFNIPAFADEITTFASKHI